jgi:geranylgeranyl reductase family protein
VPPPLTVGAEPGTLVTMNDDLVEEERPASALPARRTYDVLVVGGGPAGAAAGYWLARLGHDVVVVEKKTFPREKTCGDGLTPRAVHQLGEMGLADQLSRFHKYDGLRLTAMGKALELDWPSHPVYPPHGYVVRRRELDTMVATNAESQGATLLQGYEALSPIIERGFVRGAVVQAAGVQEPIEIRATYVVVADGANSRFGRALGTFRTKDWPYGTAIRTYWESPRHAEPWIESALDVKDRNGNPLPGYGWIFPVGDGTVNIGVGLLSTFRDFKSVNTTHLLDAYAHMVADRWEIDPDNPQCKATSGRIPMGGSVGPKSGPTYLVIGDAAGSVNPFNGEGIDYAYETGRLAAEVLHEALAGNDPTALQRYPSRLDAEYGQYFKVARLFAQVIGRPALMRELTRVGMHNRTLMEWVLRIMANLLRPDEIGPAEAAYKAAAALARLTPNS